MKILNSINAVPTSRGIYLREGTACRQSTEVSVSISQQYA